MSVHATNSNAPKNKHRKIGVLLGSVTLLASLLTIPPAAAEQGAMEIPTTGVVTGTPNGYCGSGNSHGGFDIAAPTGTNVRAAASGKVVQVGYQSRSGNLVDVEHAGGYTSRYFHLSAQSVKTGQTVTKGQVVGKVGSTGNSTGPHLHFQIERYGSVIRDAALNRTMTCGNRVQAGTAMNWGFPGLPRTGGTTPPSNPSVSYPTLRSGSSGAAVKDLQTRLKAAGRYSDAIDGKFGPNTLNAVKAFQRSVGLTVDGVVGPRTWGALIARDLNGTTLKSGQDSNQVKILQRSLNAFLGSGLTVDGKFGPATQTAVKKYQSSRGLSADGVVGAKTISAMKRGA